MAAEWDPDKALESLAMEKTVDETITDEALARKLFKEASPRAALSIINLAMHSPTEAVRLKASMYITDRVLGPAGAQLMGDDTDPLASLLGDVITQIEEHANTGEA